MPMLRDSKPPMPLANAQRTRNAPESRAHRAYGLALVIASCAFGATIVAGCASTGTSSGRLVATAPQGVDLSGEWRLNVNLSDDPGRIDEPKDTLPPPEEAPERNPGGFGKPGTTMPGMPGGPGGIDPRGNLTNTATPASGLVPVLYQSNDLPASSSDGGSPGSTGKSAGREGTVSHMLYAPELLQISQSGTKLIVKSMADGNAGGRGAHHPIRPDAGQSQRRLARVGFRGDHEGAQGTEQRGRFCARFGRTPDLRNLGHARQERPDRLQARVRPRALTQVSSCRAGRSETATLHRPT